MLPHRLRSHQLPFIILLLFSLLFSACGSSVQLDQVQTLTETVELQDATSAVVRIRMGAGNLTVSGGAQNLMDATFDYNVEAWKPEISYAVNSSVGQLEISQPGEVNLDQNLTNLRYDWNIRLNNDVPMEVDVELGAGRNQLDLSTLDLTGARVTTGAGEVVVDLSGEWQHDVTAQVQGGVGNLTIHLPQNIGAQVNVTGGLGNVDAAEFRQEGDTYYNDVFGSTENTVTVDIQGGVGQVTLDTTE